MTPIRPNKAAPCSVGSVLVWTAKSALQGTLLFTRAETATGSACSRRVRAVAGLFFRLLALVFLLIHRLQLLR